MITVHAGPAALQWKEIWCPTGAVFLQIPLGGFFLVITQTAASHLIIGNWAPVRWMDESMCVFTWAIDSPWVFSGWTVRAGTRLFIPEVLALEAPGRLAGQTSLPTSPLELGLSTGHWLIFFIL